MRVQLRYFDDCPSWRLAAQRLEALRDEFDLDIQLEIVDTPEAAKRVGFHGSPSLLADGHDLFSAGDAEVGLTCRLYATADGPAGCPTVDQIRAQLIQRRDRNTGSPR
ncbi:MAG: thioredoxin family protein [Actinomycetota bacterium]